MTTSLDDLEKLGEYKYGFHDEMQYAFRARPGLNAEVVTALSRMKGEPQWMLDFRLRALDIFFKKPMPTWGGKIDLDFDAITYYTRPTGKTEGNWDEVPSEIKDTFDKLGIPEAERKFLAGVGAQYECLAGDSRVYTAKGPVPIRAIRPGDVVFSYDEERRQIIPCAVKATACKGEREVYEVKVGTRVIRATTNHPFFILAYERKEGRQRGRYRRAWRYLHELKVGDLVAVAKTLPDVGVPYALTPPEVKTETVGRNQSVEYPLDISHLYNDVKLPQETTEDLMWLLGLYLGDGCVHRENGKDKARVEFAIPETDPQLQRELMETTERVFGLPLRRGDAYRLTLYSTIVAHFFEVNGFGGDAHTKRVPTWVHALPRSQRLAFLGGYLDSDGYVRDSAKNHDAVFTSVNEAMLDDVRALISQCGLNTSQLHRFSSAHPFDKERSITAYRMMAYGATEVLGSRSERRRERLGKNKFNHNYSSAEGTKFVVHTDEYVGFAKIEAITSAGRELVYDIEVDGPHNFVAEGLVVHNSEMVYHNIQKKLEEQGVIFLSSDDGLRQHPEVYKEYFGTVVPPMDNKFAACNSAVWSGGSFVYIPKGVKVEMPLQAYFRLNAEGTGQFERTLIIVDEGAQAHYIEGCFLAGARVRTRSGEKPIETVAVGDEVLTHRGRYRKVYRTMERPYRGMLYRLRYFGDSSQELRVTAEHPVLVVPRERAHNRNRTFAPEWLPASEVKPGDYLAIPIPQPDSVFEPQRTVTVPMGSGSRAPVMKDVTLPLEPDFFRLLGYYYAEGHAEQEHYLSFSFHVGETAYLDDTRALIQRYFGKAPIENKPRQNGQSLVLCSTEAARTFTREFGSTVYDKHVPEYIRNAPPAQLREWVRGMWCGDGSYDGRKNMFRFNTVSHELAYAFRDALLRLGVAASVNRQAREAPRRAIYAVVISSPWNARFGEMVGCPAPDGHPSGSPFQLDDQYLYVPIRAMEIEPVNVPVYNFSVEEDESYVCEGVVSHNCTAPTYSRNSFHSGVIEIIVKKNARFRYTTIQNWSTNVYNLVTQRSVVHAGATMEWVDANLGSCLTMKYPSCYLVGEGAHGEILSMAFAGPNQHQDTGGKMIHGAPHTSSKITSKSISRGGGRASYRGLLKIYKGAYDSRSKVVCDALLLDDKSRTDTYPVIEVDENDVSLGHEASVSKVSEDQLFYLMSRGLSEEQAASMVVGGFIEPLVKELPMEYAVELNRLVQLQMEGSVG